MEVIVKFKKLNQDAQVPIYMTDGASGMDVKSSSVFIISPGEVCAVETGLSVEISRGYEIQVRPRSGLALKNKIAVLNSPGTIDADFRGEIKVILYNHGTEHFYVYKGDRIAQLVVAPVIRATIEEVDELDKTERGAGGFGSTGK